MRHQRNLGRPRAGRPARQPVRSRTSSPPRKLPRVYEISAGGVVVRRLRGQWHVALLKTRHRRGEVWVLPKGHIEEGKRESTVAAAAREVREELGITNIRVVRKLGTVRWQFLGERLMQGGHGVVLKPGPNGQAAARGKPVRVVKTVHHFLIEGLSDRLRPQASEGFLEARWVPLREALQLITYPTDREILRKVPRDRVGGAGQPPAKRSTRAT